MVCVFLGPHLTVHRFFVLIDDGSESIKRFNGTNANQVGARLPLAVPLCKHVPKRGVVHVFNKQIAKRMVLKVDNVIVSRHGTNPTMPISFTPALPVDFIRADCARQSNG